MEGHGNPLCIKWLPFHTENNASGGGFTSPLGYWGAGRSLRPSPPYAPILLIEVHRLRKEHLGKGKRLAAAAGIDHNTTFQIAHRLDKVGMAKGHWESFCCSLSYLDKTCISSCTCGVRSGCRTWACKTCERFREMVAQRTTVEHIEVSEPLKPLVKVEPHVAQNPSRGRRPKTQAVFDLDAWIDSERPGMYAEAIPETVDTPFRTYQCYACKSNVKTWRTSSPYYLERHEKSEYHRSHSDPSGPVLKIVPIVDEQPDSTCAPCEGIRFDPQASQNSSLTEELQIFKCTESMNIWARHGYPAAKKSLNYHTSIIDGVAVLRTMKCIDTNAPREAGRTVCVHCRQLGPHPLILALGRDTDWCAIVINHPCGSCSLPMSLFHSMSKRAVGFPVHVPLSSLVVEGFGDMC